MKSGLMNKRGFLIVKHPEDDKDSHGKITSSGKTHSIDALVLDSPSEIAKRITPQTKYVFISGANFYTNNLIINLFKEILDSGRDVHFSGINLTYEGKPFNHIGELMALADFHILCKSSCSICNSPANRSTETAKNCLKYADPRCLKHWPAENRPDHKYHLIDQLGKLKLYTGSMYSSKTETMIEEFSAIKTPKGSYKWKKEQRYGNKKGIKTNDLRIHKAKEVGNAYEILADLKNKMYSSLMIDEPAFLEGIEDAVEKLILTGYQVYAATLLRDFRREPFIRVPKLLCLADEIENVHYGICNNNELSRTKECFHPSVETQRFVIKENQHKKSATYNEPIVLVGATDYYTTSCRKCHKVLDEPKKMFDIPPIICR